MIQILINNPTPNDRVTSRKMVHAEVIKQNRKTIVVRLTDGNHTKRSIKRDIGPLNFEGTGMKTL